MKAVLYATDLEPITILSLEPWAVEYLHRYRQVRLAVADPRILYDMQIPDDEVASSIRLWTVTIRAERLRIGRFESMMLFTEDEEAALLLKAAFLPGQTRVLRDRDAEVFAKGFLHAISRLR